ncbi:amidase signature enzyme [Annulohypoxylon maeteangense]|uniref:amidase signature enzyme n=1 Tax=Annulohypoxylon maeteangense TaxID=1927788 RepID=UPI00200857F8|nr:amidase signature enzyme [Annulohypoxylon maeteangense]KAI0884184.1 amidase signature enzyme [Annulohypoxylon maeteangense]
MLGSVFFYLLFPQLIQGQSPMQPRCCCAFSLFRDNKFLNPISFWSSPQSHIRSSSTMMAKPYVLTAIEVLNLLKSNTITVEDYASSLLERIKERDSIVQAWAYLDPAFVLSQARALDQVPQEQRGPLHGLAIGVKDIMNTKDMPTQFGSPIYKGNQPGFDSSAVAILRAAGALIFGKTTTTEFTVTNSGGGDFGPNTTNPHDPNRTPGGSSSGSAAAVADLQVTVSLGAQTGGSIIRPASFTGVYAMKPTYNAISPEGQKTFSPTFDTFGFFARSVDDLQLLADVFGLKDDKVPREIPLTQIKVALIETPMWPSAGPGTREAMDAAAGILRNKGVQVEKVDLPSEANDFSTLKRIQKVITVGEAQVAFFREYEVNKTNLSPDVRGIVENTYNYTHKEVMEATDAYASMRRAVNKLAEDYSFILAPSVVDEAPLGLDDMGSAAFNTLWTGFHMPVINVPGFYGAHGMPISLSLVAPRYHDQHLLKMSKVFSELLGKSNPLGVKVQI